MKLSQTLTLFSLALVCTTAMHGMHQRKTGTSSSSSSSTTIAAPGSSSSPYENLKRDSEEYKELSERYKEVKGKLSACEKTIDRKKKEWRNVGPCSCLKGPYICCKADEGNTACATLTSSLAICSAGIIAHKNIPEATFLCMYLGCIAPFAYVKCMEKSLGNHVKTEEEEKLRLENSINDMKEIFRSVH